MPTSEILTIGSELLNGSVLNSNAHYLSQALTDLSVDVVRQTACRDRENEIMDALQQAIHRSNIVILCGGLGPTPDDITREAVARFFGGGLTFHPKHYRRIVEYFRSLKRETPAATKREAYFPSKSKPLINKHGIALGFYISVSNRLIVALPGVPGELVRMFQGAVAALIVKKFPIRQKKYTLTAKITGIYEPEVMRRLGKKFFKNRDFEFGIYPNIGDITIRIKSTEKSLIPKLRRDLKRTLAPHLYSFSDESMMAVLGRTLRQKKMSLAAAESCTGGLLSKLITDAPGASRFFWGGTIAYSNQVKGEHLDVSKDLLQRKGAVSREVAAALAQGVKHKYRTSLGVSITGIAGPGGGNRKKPVGLVYIGLSDSKRTRVSEFRFRGERSKVRLQAARKALNLLWQWTRK